MTPNPSVQAASVSGDQSQELRLISEQREVALACFVLSTTISIAVLWSSLGGEPKAIGEAREDVALHRTLFHQHQILLADNQKVLTEVEAARDALVRARARR
jgi:hypothetical protein